MNKKILCFIIPTLIFTLAGCSTSKGSSEKSEESKSEEQSSIAPEADEHYYDKINQRVKFDESSELNFDDEITEGLNDDVWNTLDGYWEAGGISPHNGVRRRNLFYTKDNTGNGYLAMKARGVYNQTDPSILGKPEGACIESKNKLGPGRYEVYMAAMPRDGGVSAFWTYGSKTGSEATSQNEIDIEIGGDAQYTNLWCTTWTTHTNKATHAPDVSNICYMNDGRIHKYTFDWYTNYPGTGEGRIDWFIDGKFVQQISGGTVPAAETPVWLGIWLPSWAGNSLFIEDYMLIDRISYKSFDASQDYEECRSYTTYVPKKPSESDIQTVDFESITTKLNKLSNAGFESTDEYRDNDMYGWIKQTGYNSNVELSDEHTEGEHSFYITPGEGGTKKDVAYYHQELTCAYEGPKYDFSIDAKLKDEESKAYVWIWYNDYSGMRDISKQKLEISSTSFTTISDTLKMPDGAGRLYIYLVVEKGGACFDNAKLCYVGL